MLVLGASDDERSPLLGAVGIFGYLLGGPSVHGVHGQNGRAFASLGLHLAGGGLLALTCVNCDVARPAPLAILVVPTLLDATLLAFEPRDSVQRKSDVGRHGALRITLHLEPLGAHAAGTF